MWILVLVLVLIIILILCFRNEKYLYLKDKLFVNNGSQLDTEWRNEQVYGANQYPDGMYSRKNFLGPGFYSTTGWQISPRVNLKEDKLPIMGRWNDNSVKGAQKFYRLFY
jgi:hypothetical protein